MAVNLVPLMSINFTWNNKNNQSAVGKKCKLLQAIVKNGDAQCIKNIWNRCFCNYDTHDDYAVFNGLCWYPRSWVMLQACGGALNWNRGLNVLGKNCPLCFLKCFLSVEFLLVVNYYPPCSYQIVILCHEISQVCWCGKSSKHKHATFWTQAIERSNIWCRWDYKIILWGLV